MKIFLKAFGKKTGEESCEIKIYPVGIPEKESVKWSFGANKYFYLDNSDIEYVDEDLEITHYSNVDDCSGRKIFFSHVVGHLKNRNLYKFILINGCLKLQNLEDDTDIREYFIKSSYTPIIGNEFFPLIELKEKMSTLYPLVYLRPMPYTKPVGFIGTTPIFSSDVHKQKKGPVSEDICTNPDHEYSNYDGTCAALECLLSSFENDPNSDAEEVTAQQEEGVGGGGGGVEITFRRDPLYGLTEESFL